MSVDTVTNALRFWHLAEQALIEIYGWQPSAAHTEIQRAQGRITEAAIARDVVYHFEPLEVANDIATAGKPVSDAMWRIYDELVARIGDSEHAADPHCRDNGPTSQASKNVRPVAAMIR